MTLSELAELAMRHNGSIGFSEEPSPEGLALASNIAQLVLDELGVSQVSGVKALPLSRLIALEIAPAFGVAPIGAREDFVARLGLL